MHYRPDRKDPAWNAGMTYADNLMLDDVPLGVIRQAFWCGVKWAREQRSLPVVGKITDDGILWSSGD